MSIWLGRKFIFLFWSSLGLPYLYYLESPCCGPDFVSSCELSQLLVYAYSFLSAPTPGNAFFWDPQGPHLAGIFSILPPSLSHLHPAAGGLQVVSPHSDVIPWRLGHNLLFVAFFFSFGCNFWLSLLFRNIFLLFIIAPKLFYLIS